MTEGAEQIEGTEEDSGFAEAWRPSPGSTITGTLANVELIDPNGNGAYPCVLLKTGDGERAVHAFHTVLRREIARRRPKIGDELTITYLGQKDGGKNGTYHAYRVRGGSGAEFNWENELPPEERLSQQDVPIAPAPTPSQPVPEPGSQFGAEPPF